MLRLLLIKSELWDKQGKRYNPEICIAPAGYNAHTLFNDSMIFIPDPYVAGECVVSSEIPGELEKFSVYQSYTEND